VGLNGERFREKWWYDAKKKWGRGVRVVAFSGVERLSDNSRERRKWGKTSWFFKKLAIPGEVGVEGGSVDSQGGQ